ncbi:low-density lipoprotein receptor-related protein 8-like [Triplophysa dalaica]|uniref:low-density lipoprotein receptor-related protein 8-like n=1 Tax=Triplophysa dalaica TaxID=1582913 RepID=UPI0024DFAB7F|nr:low-density lipoprotein receptor-related protein 8-like [Triplophysa dalaica]
MGHSSLLLVLIYVLYLPLTEVFASFQKCSSEEFSCNDGRCLPLNLRCDGVDHCGDSSDESTCFDCNTGSLNCVASAPCIHSSNICDGKPDCPDGADENDCTDLNTKVCSKSEFTCANGQCVVSSWRCDHSNDCQDGSDELGCDLNECEYDNGGCSHLCVDLPLGFICDCPSGMRLLQDTHCEDVDHCLDSDVCDQICIYSNESIACECQDGYDLTSGTGQCKATGGEAHMVVCTHEGIKWMDLYGSEERNITSWVTMGSPGPIAAGNAKNKLYWASPDDDHIYRISVDSSDHTHSELIKASTGILGLAVDELHEHLYWVSTSTHGLHVVSFNGSDQKQIISGLSRPTAVAVQPLKGHLFWADSGTSPRIERARLDGHQRIVLITSSIYHPVALSLDIPRGLLYWADSGLHTISRVAFDGNHRKTVVESNGYLDRPFGLAVFESRVYWSDQLTNSTCSANKHNGKELQVSQKLGSVLPAGLAILQPSLWPAEKDLPPTETKTTLTDSAFAWILFLTAFLSLLLVGAVICWRRSEFDIHRSLSLIGHISFKESQDPLLVTGPPMVHEHKDSTQSGPEM